VKLFRRRKNDNAEEDEPLLDADVAEEDSIRETTEAAAGASTDPPAQAGAVPPAGDPLAQMRADAAAEVAAAEDPLAGVSSHQPADSLDPGLMDLFREAKDEVEEATLASQLPDIPIQELLGDLVNVSERLGVKPRPHLEPNPDEAGERGLDPDEGGK